jgi:hypothetical protein
VSDRTKRVMSSGGICQQFLQRLTPAVVRACGLALIGTPQYDPWEQRVKAVETAAVDLLRRYNPDTIDTDRANVLGVALQALVQAGAGLSLAPAHRPDATTVAPPPSDQEALRAFVAAVNDFIEFAKGVSDAGTPLGPKYIDLIPRTNLLIQAIQSRRQAAVVAGVHIGEPRRDMDLLLKQCIDLCYGYQNWVREQDPNPKPYPRLTNALAPQLAILQDLIAIAEGGPTPTDARKKDDAASAAEQALDRTALAVLTILRGLPDGQGIDARAILGRLKGRKIELEESTLRRHVLPKLKPFGLDNHRAAGGYFIRPENDT